MHLMTVQALTVRQRRRFHDQAAAEVPIHRGGRGRGMFAADGVDVGRQRPTA